MQQNPYRIEDVSLVGKTAPTSTPGRKRQYPWSELKVGQSFYVAYDEGAPTQKKLERRLRNAINWSRRKGHIPLSHKHGFLPYPEKKPTGLLVGRIK